jgi:hypothetical protein
MNRADNPEAVSILELMVKNPYNTNIPVKEFYRVIQHFYGLDRGQIDKGIWELEERAMVLLSCTGGGDIETVVAVTEKGNDLACQLSLR